MKQAFLLFVGGFCVVALVAGAIYVFVRAIVTIFQDRAAAREAVEIAVEAEKRREERKQQNATRLDNGCEHQWGGIITAFPDNACQKCGLEKERPIGPCDHVWRLQMDSRPFATCQKCSKRFITESEVFQTR